MYVYVYNADIYCEKCGRQHVIACGEADAKLGRLSADASDSNSYPQGPYPDGGGEADCPQHCADCNVFLENPLTPEGQTYVAECVTIAICAKKTTAESVALSMWLPFYDYLLTNKESDNAA